MTVPEVARNRTELCRIIILKEGAQLPVTILGQIAGPRMNGECQRKLRALRVSAKFCFKEK